jgi:hypothetical protein
MAKKKTVAESPAMDDWRRRVDFSFGKDSLKEPAGLRELTVGETVTVLVTGKVKTLRLDEEGSGLCISMDKIDIEGCQGCKEAKDDDLSAALATTRRKL